jgi:hypothetical protein
LKILNISPGIYFIGSTNSLQLPEFQQMSGSAGAGKGAPEQSAAGAGAAQPSSEMRECRCMFCGQLLLLTSEAEAIEHMAVCPALSEQLANANEAFTIPKCVEKQMYKGDKPKDTK